MAGGCAFEVVCGAGAVLDAGALAWLEGKAREALAAIGVAGEVRARLVGDAEMSRSHERYCGVSGTTDVITFNLGAGPGGEPDPGGEARSASAMDVDLLICIDEAARAAAARGHGVEREVLLYVVHGVLHCLGYDDHVEEDAAEMHAREDEILTEIGVGAVYARDAAGGAS